MKSNIYAQLIFQKDNKTVRWIKGILFYKQCQENWVFVCKRIKLGTYFIPYAKANSKWIKHFYKKIQGKCFMTLDLAIISWIWHQKAQETTIKTDKLGYIKILNFRASKDTTNGVKRQCTEWEKVFESDLCWSGITIQTT